MNKKFVAGAVLFLILATSFDSAAQCAMCRATAETAAKHLDRGIGAGLNSGIIYLMGIPYMLLMTVAIVFYRKKIAAFFRG
ncbi:MAG: hypothetical protein ACOVOO_07795 [Flavobacteriales bacterium]|jgi:hypothetical protein